MQNQQLEDTIEDEILVTRTQQGDSSAFASLVERHRTACLKLAMSILRDTQDAEDEVQNACWKAYEHISQFQGDARFSTWLTRIVVNQCLMRLRQRRRNRFVYLEDTLNENAKAMDLPSETISPEDELGKSEVAEVVEQEISRIPPLLRNILVLRDVQELRMQDAADQLGISLAAAKSRLLRARMELRSRLRRHEGRLGAATLLA